MRKYQRYPVYIREESATLDLGNRIFTPVIGKLPLPLEHLVSCESHMNVSIQAMNIVWDSPVI